MERWKRVEDSSSGCDRIVGGRVDEWEVGWIRVEDRDAEVRVESGIKVRNA